MNRALFLAALCLAGCSTSNSQAAKAASGLRLGMIPRDVVRELGVPGGTADVSPHIREWYYSYTGDAPTRRMPNEPEIRWTPKPTSRLIVRFENGEVVGWRRE
jgi:outer membrane protein assembly factor BamE (lipoprotein component of BamABCDE complex)